MSNGHCEHCGVDCTGGKPNPSYFGEKTPHILDEKGLVSLRWVDGACPACAERERIAKWMKEQGWESLRPGGTSQLLADAIERGDHLKESI